jgi:peptidoglycan LD-endopeptidase CwlK
VHAIQAGIFSYACRPNARLITPKEILMQLNQMIEAIQKTLGVQADGRAGPETWGAIYTALVLPKIAEQPATFALAPVDARSEKVIVTLLPEVQDLARALVQKAAANGIQVKLLSGLRSYAEQDALYAQGRTTAGTKITQARAGHSNHNFGIAFDIGVFVGNKYLADAPQYKAVGALGMELGLEWGGNWKTIVDQPHFQLRPVWAAQLTEREMLAALRGRVAAGAAIYA